MRVDISTLPLSTLLLSKKLCCKGCIRWYIGGVGKSREMTYKAISLGMSKVTILVANRYNNKVYLPSQIRDHSSDGTHLNSKWNLSRIENPGREMQLTQRETNRLVDMTPNEEPAPLSDSG